MRIMNTQTFKKTDDANADRDDFQVADPDDGSESARFNFILRITSETTQLAGQPERWLGRLVATATGAVENVSATNPKTLTERLALAIRRLIGPEKDRRETMADIHTLKAEVPGPGQERVVRMDIGAGASGSYVATVHGNVVAAGPFKHNKAAIHVPGSTELVSINLGVSSVEESGSNSYGLHVIAEQDDGVCGEDTYSGDIPQSPTPVALFVYFKES